MQDIFPTTKAERLMALQAVGLTENASEPLYDDAVQIAVALFGTPIAYVSLTDKHRRWVAAKIGVRGPGDEPGQVFSTQVFSTGARLVVEDATVDPRFSDHESVTGRLHLRFFAGVPLFVDDEIVGALCVLDTVPRIADSRKLMALAALGRQVSDVLRQRATTADMAIKEHAMSEHVHEARQSSTLHRFAARRFETLFHGVPIACFTFDGKTVIHEWNREAERVFGIPAFDVIDESMYRTLSLSRRSARAVTAIEEVLRGETVEGIEWTYRRADGDNRRLLSSAFPLRGPQGQIVGGVCSTIDITERKLQERALRRANSQLEGANSRLERLASHDGLTGIANYRAFNERLDAAYAQATRHNEPMALLLIDVDRFKALNDTFGHPVGDRVLQELATIFQDVSRTDDFVARYGGEEFAMILPKTDLIRARRVGERVRRAVTQHPWTPEPITISIGCATLDETVRNAQDLVIHADQALYQSKRDGRDRVTLYGQTAA
jgi:diguanylate cyclase (GGDEF)-like protein/PAS domain S-box-containing protein